MIRYSLECVTKFPLILSFSPRGEGNSGTIRSGLPLPLGRGLG